MCYCNETNLPASAGLDAGADRRAERTGRANQCQDGGWVFRGIGAPVLRMQRKGDEKEKSAERHEHGFLH